MPEERKYSGFERLMLLDKQRAEERKNKRSGEGAVNALKAVDSPGLDGAVDAVNALDADHLVNAPKAVNPVSAPNALRAVKAVKAPTSKKRLDQGTQPSAAPMRDFSKVANSIMRDAVAGGYFKGKSKQLYDYFYSQTRGYITPRYAVRMSRTQIMAGAHIGSIHTLTQNIAYLQNVLKLIQVESLVGERDGNLYTVYLPEEVGLGQSGQLTHLTTSTQLSAPSQLAPLPVGADTASTAPGSDSISSTTYRDTNTLSKTYKPDDEAFDDLIRILGDATERTVGTTPNRFSREKWAEVALLLVEELDEAVARTTDSVASVPGLLAAHIRRKRLSFQRQSAKGLKVSTKDVVGKEVDETVAKKESALLDETKIDESIDMFRELLVEGGYNLAKLSEQFAAGFSGQDWARILAALQGPARVEDV